MIESLVIVLPFIHPREKRVRKKYHYKVSLGVSVCLHISYIWVVTSQPPARVAARLVSYCFCCDATTPLRQREHLFSTEFDEHKHLKLNFYDSERKADIIILKLLVDKGICFCVGENPEFPLMIWRGADPCISASSG